MEHKKALKAVSAVAIIAGIIALLIWGFIEGRKELATEKERERPVKPPLRVSAVGGESVVTLDAGTQARSGIAVSPLSKARHREEVSGYGLVLDASELTALYNNLISTKAQIEKGEASLNASGREYERLKSLNADKNISDKALEGAEAVRRSDEAALYALKESIRTFEDSISQKWGKVVARWVIEGSAPFKRLSGLDELLVQVTLPHGMEINNPPALIHIQGAGSAGISARFISPAPRTDPRIQGIGLLYIASGKGIVPGMSVTASLPVGKNEVSGVIIPDSALVWWQGKGWVYVQKDSSRFVRREVPSDAPVESGWFAEKGFTAGERVVVRGAQMLLSEEFRSEVQVGEEGEKK